MTFDEGIALTTRVDLSRRDVLSAALTCRVVALAGASISPPFETWTAGPVSFEDLMRDSGYNDWVRMEPRQRKHTP